MNLYGPLNTDHKRVGYVEDGFYQHPAYDALTVARQKLELARMLIDEALGAIPETPTKGAALLQLHTASMWLDKALDVGREVLENAYNHAVQQAKQQAQQQANAEVQTPAAPTDDAAVTATRTRV